jgi:hypothetical protein
VTVWRTHHLVTSYQYQCERESVELASPVDVERSSFIFKAMGKISRPDCDKNGCKCKKQRKAVTLEEKLLVIYFTRFGVTR